MVTVPNPNFPILFAEGQFGANPYFSSITTIPPTELSKRLYQMWSTQRGKQFELDAVQAGEFQGSWINTDGKLDPGNAASPLNPNLLPYRGYQIRAQWPPSVNLLTADQATGGEGTPLAAGTTGVSSGVTGAYGNLVVTASGTAFQGTSVWQFTGTTGSTGLALASVQAAGIGQTDGLGYVQSMRVRSVTTSANPQVQPFIQWVDALGNVVSTVTGAGVNLTGSPSAAWTMVTISGMMPTSGNAVSGRMGVFLSVAPAGTWSFQVDGLQWEQNTVASGFAVPGKTYYVFSGVIERYPQSWEYTGTYGLVNPVVVDSMAMLSQQALKAAFVGDVLALGPNFLYQLNDPLGSTSCVDAAFKRVAAPVENSPFGVGSLVFGNAITSTTAAGSFLGSPGPVAAFANSISSFPAQNPDTFISIHKTTATPGPPTSIPWTRVIAFRCTTGNGGTLWNAQSFSWTGSASHLEISVSGGSVGFDFEDHLGNFMAFTSAVGYDDGQWHMAAIAVDSGSGNGSLWIDGALVSTQTGLSFMAVAGSDVLGCNVALGSNFYTEGLTGNLAHAIEFPFFLTNTQILNLYNSWRSAYLGESSGARYARILGWAGYTGPTAIDSGATTSMGAATDIVGIDALSCLGNVVLTENGQHFIAGNGAATFQARTRRYGQLTPTYIFGDATPPTSEIPYELVSFDFDTTHISNLVQVTQTSTSQVFFAQDTTSQGIYGTRSLTRSNQTTSPNECQDAAIYLTSRYKDPHLRVATLRLHPSSNPSVLFPVCLSLELGTRVRVMRRPPAPAAPIQLDGFIEQIVHSMDDQGQWYVDLQVSTADTSVYWQLAALHTTLNAQTASGQNQAIINALPDAAVNKLASSLPSGYQLTFEPGTANQETMTIAAGGIPSTTLGYTSATLTFTTNFTFTHAVNTTVCEPLPGTVTDPTTWDTVSILGATYTTVLSGGGSGTNTVTVNPMSDSVNNGLALNWIVGDTLWLSPGTANFETAVVSSVASLYANYTSAVITFTANLTHSHAVGDFVCEPLPGGQTNPTSLTPAPTARLGY